MTDDLDARIAAILADRAFWADVYRSGWDPGRSLDLLGDRGRMMDAVKDSKRFWEQHPC